MTCVSCKRKSGESGEWWEAWFHVFGEAVCWGCFEVLLPPDLLARGYYVSPVVMHLLSGRIDRWSRATDYLWGARR